MPWYRQRPGALCSTKVSQGLIILNPRAQAKFSLISSELSRLAEKANDKAGVSTKLQDQHHNPTTAVLSYEEKVSAS